MKRYLLILGLVILGAMSLLVSQSDTAITEEGKITHFVAEDIPHDDGSGILLRWKPLDRSHRIIQYNVYRGVHPDSLFMLSHLEVDPKLGVMSDELFFYDKDYPTLIDFETAPARIRKEKHQAPGSPLLQRMPRDPKVLATILDRYTVLGIVNSSTLYNRSKKISLTDESIAAGLKVNQFEYLMANVNEGQTYYYSVLAVNERGHRLPHAAVQSVVPVNNRPDTTAVMRSVYLADTGEMRFEWNPPQTARDIASWEAWMMPLSLIPAYNAAQAQAEASPFEGDFSAAWKAGSLPLFEIPATYSAQNIYHTATAEEMALPAGFDPARYQLVFGYEDYTGLNAFSLGRAVVTASSADLPSIPNFRMMDKINDKGDYLYASIGKPIVFITQASYTSSKRDRLRINYEIADNEVFTIDKVRFRFFDGEKPLGEVMEHFTDQIIQLRLPSPGSQPLEDIKVQIAVKTTSEKDFNPIELIQYLKYDSQNRRFSGNVMELDGQKLNRLYFDLFTKTPMDGDFSGGYRMGGLSRSYDLNVSYEAQQYMVLQGYDPSSRRFALDHNLMVAADAETGNYLSVPLFREEFEKQLSEMEEQIKELESSLAAAVSEEEKAPIAAELEHYKAQLEYTRTHPTVLEAAGKRGSRAWLKTFIKARDRNTRSHAFRLLVTNGRGLYNISETFEEDGNIWLYPKSEWFDSTKWITLLSTIILVLLVGYGILIARRRDLYIRPIAGLEELDNAVGRATEMGRPVMFVPGWGTLGEPCTISAMMILSQIARKTAEYDIRLISPHVDYFVVPLAQEMVKTAYSEVGRPDSYVQNDIFFVSDVQFAFSAAVNGITIRDRVATIFYMGYFNAEALLMTETGNQTGAIQIAASDAITQIPFFITTCDYTLIGEEFYAASAYLSKNPDIVSMLKSQDYFKLIIVVSMFVGTILSTLHIMEFIRLFPVE